MGDMPAILGQPRALELREADLKDANASTYVLLFSFRGPSESVL
jgi:hypothetical protein